LGVGWLERAIVGQVLGEPPIWGVFDLISTPIVFLAKTEQNPSA
jgi:hypothetical protein